MLKIKLVRTGKKKQPHYRVVIAEAKSKISGKYKDLLGHYNPLSKKAVIAIDKKKYLDWIKKGAQPTQTVYNLFRKQHGKTS